MGSGGGVLGVSVYIHSTRGSGVLASAGHVLMRGVGGVCDMCMCLALGGVGGEGEWVTGLGLGFSISRGPWGKWGLCFGCGGVCGVRGELVGGLDQGLGGWGGVMSVCVVSLDYLC